VLHLPVPPGERLIGDALHEGLEEPVLATLGRAGIGLEE
jgi:hypothetical protein